MSIARLAHLDQTQRRSLAEIRLLFDEGDINDPTGNRVGIHIALDPGPIQEFEFCMNASEFAGQAQVFAIEPSSSIYETECDNLRILAFTRQGRDASVQYIDFAAVCDVDL